MKSFTEIGADKILAATDKYLQEREDRIEKRRLRFIEGMMQKDAGFFSFRKYTEEEAVSLWETCGDFISPRARAENEGGFWADKAYALRSLARVAINNSDRKTIQLSAEDACFIERYLK
jgi:hypothetical protein